MKKIITLLAILLFSTQLQAAESRFQKSFTVKNDPKSVQEWMTNHRNDLLKATGCKILERNGKEVKVSRQTPRGEFIFAIQESIKGNKYISKFVKSYQGEITGQETKITIEPYKGKTRITIEIWAQVDMPDVTGLEIRIDLLKSYNGMRKCISKMFDEEQETSSVSRLRF